MNAIMRWYQEDPATAMARVQGLTNLQERNNLMRMIVSVAGRSNPEEALALVRDYAPDDQDLERLALVSWAQFNRNDAMPSIEAYVARTGDSRVLVQVMSNWAQQDPRAAIAYAQTLNSEHRDSVMPGIAGIYVSTDPRSAMTWLMSLDDLQIRRRAISSLPRADVNLAETWLRRVDDENMQQTLLQGIASVKADTDPEAAMQWLASQQGNAGYEAAVSNVMNQWARTSPEGSAGYLARYEQDDQFQGAFGSTASAWARRDLGSAVAWFQSLPEGPNRDSVGRTLALQSVRQDVDVTLDILDQLDGSLASDLRFQVASRWASREPDELEDIISQMGLDSRQAAQLRKQPR
ncbi:MAG: hypothetical protein O2780_04695 [Proteobacteria bacterium]|nr:hypothetical protein [Pseudomonadota bacterium]MDA1301239.1 hypothetical protein [Pseudomonadota bacterium]